MIRRSTRSLRPLAPRHSILATVLLVALALLPAAPRAQQVIATESIETIHVAAVENEFEVAQQGDRRGGGGRMEGRVRLEPPATTAPATTGTATVAPTPRPTPAPGSAEDLQTTIPLNLQNMQIDQLVKFLGDTTGKPVIKGKDLQAQVNITSPRPVTKAAALQLITDALQMQGIYVVDLGDQIQIVKSDQIRSLPLRSIGDSEDIQALPDTPQIAQKIYRLQNISADQLSKHMEKLVPAEAMTVDTASNTVILIDQLSRLKRYDRVIRALDQIEDVDRTIEVIPLRHADAMELGALLGNILTDPTRMTGPGGQSMQNLPPEVRERMMRRSGGRGGAVSITAGDATIVPDPRNNWLIIAAPAHRMPEIRELIAQFDIPEGEDVQTRMIPVHFIDVNQLSQIVERLFVEGSDDRAARDQIRAVPSDDGRSLVVLSSLANYERIREMVSQLDTEDSGKRETRTYQVKHVEAQDMATQLQELFDQQSSSRNNPWWGYSSRSSSQEPSFVPSPRTNSLMVLARPRDFAFIEQMITELDVAIDPGTYEPRIFHIRNTDANEVLKVLQALFDRNRGGSSQRTGLEWLFGGSSRNQQTDSLDAQFGKIRFVVDNVTNTIVALSSNPANYAIIEGVIAKLDRFDDEMTQVLIYELKHADALDIANHINNIFSDGPVQRPGGGQNRQQDGGGSSENSSEQEMMSYFADSDREITYPWQSAGRERQRAQEEERPINTMIGNVRIVPDVSSNKLIIACPPIYFAQINAMLEELDQPEPQVHIATRIVELTRGEDRRIGIRWTPDRSQIEAAELEGAILGLGQLGFVDTVGSGNPFNVTNPFATQTEGGNTVLTADLDINLLIQLLIKNSNSRIISEPKLTVNNNERGHFKVVSKFPFIENSQITDNGSQNQSFTFEDVGIIVYLRPHINVDGDIVMKASIENSKVREGELANGQFIRDIQRLETETFIKSGETMVIGGILDENRQEIRRGVPILSRIPVVKYLFSKRDQSALYRELIFFLTPEVMRNVEERDALRERSTDILRDADPFPEKPYLQPGTSIQLESPGETAPVEEATPRDPRADRLPTSDWQSAPIAVEIPREEQN